MEIQEVIRRWQTGGSQRQIGEGTGLSRVTVRKYLAAAMAAGVAQDGPAPDEVQLSRLAGIRRAGPRRMETPVEDRLIPWGDQIYRWLTGDRLQVTRIQELLAARGCGVSYTSLRRFNRKRNWGRKGIRTVRMADTEPGEVAEADFGRLRMMAGPVTGRRRAVWVLIVVLAYSRHGFVWPTSNQKMEEVIAGLEAAWAFFGGIPKYLVVDNFPAAVAGPDPLHPRFTQGFLEYSQHRGFVADPARVRHPKEERGVRYVREPLFKGGDFDGLPHLRTEAQRWCLEIAGTRIHGTTRRQPLQVFQDEERRALLPWDGEPYEIAHWRTAKVHPDHHVACQYALYSVPASLCSPGQKMEVRVDSKLVRIYRRGKLVKVHDRQPRGGRSTDPEDYPAELTAYTMKAPERIKGESANLGPAVAEFADRLFDGPLPWAKIRQGHKLLRLGERYTPQRLDVDLIDVRRLERILVQALEQESLPQIPLPSPEGRFARPGSVFSHVKGGQS